MANPYTSVSVSGYNSTPPTDDGAQTTNNKVTWTGIKTKLGDPLNTAVAAINTNVAAAFLLAALGGSVPTENTDVTAVVGDQGATYNFTGSVARNLFLPAAATCSNPFVLGVANNMTANLTIDPSGVETINGAATLTVGPGGSGLLICSGSAWVFIGFSNTVGLFSEFPSGFKTLTFSSTPTGWTKDATINDAGIQLVSGTIGADAGTVAFSSVFVQTTIAKANLPSYNLGVTDPLHNHAVHTSTSSGAAAGSGAGTVWRLDGNNLGLFPQASASMDAAATGISVQSQGSGTAIDLRLRYAQANRITKT